MALPAKTVFDKTAVGIVDLDLVVQAVCRRFAAAAAVASGGIQSKGDVRLMVIGQWNFLHFELGTIAVRPSALAGERVAWTVDFVSFSSSGDFRGVPAAVGGQPGFDTDFADAEVTAVVTEAAHVRIRAVVKRFIMRLPFEFE